MEIFFSQEDYMNRRGRPNRFLQEFQPLRHHAPMIYELNRQFLRGGEMMLLASDFAIIFRGHFKKFEPAI
jgi:hypothetical protein